MKTLPALFLLCLLALAQKAAAQAVATDSTTTTKPAKPDLRADRLRALRDMRPGLRPPSAPYPGKAAREARFDAARFRLDKTLIPKVRNGEISATSDYFKPTNASAQLLADSAYVKDYRYFAYNNGIRQLRHPVGTGLIIGGGVLILVTGFIALIIALSHVHFQPTMY